MKEVFVKSKVNHDNFLFIDGISKSFKASEKDKQVLFVDSPGALTEISLVITKSLKHNFDYLIFDSLNNLLTYQDKNTVTKFVSSIVTKIKSSKTKAVFLAVKTADNEDVIKKCSMFVDAIV